jgi:tetracycline repressor-like protein
VVHWQCQVIPRADCVEVTGSHVGLIFNRKVHRAVASAFALPELPATTIFAPYLGVDSLTIPVMTTAPDRHARRREATRANLVDAAKGLFARQGVDNTRIQEITDEADVGFGPFYNHFESKEALIEVVLADTIAAQAAEIDALTAQLDDPAEIVLRPSDAASRR